MDLYYLKRPQTKTFVYRKKRFSDEIKQGYRMIFSVMIVLILGSSFAYINVQTQSAALGYYLAKIKFENEGLKNTSLDLTHQVLEAGAVSNLTGQVSKYDMSIANADNVAYVNGETDIAVMPFRIDK